MPRKFGVNADETSSVGDTTTTTQPAAAPIRAEDDKTASDLADHKPVTPTDALPVSLQDLLKDFDADNLAAALGKIKAACDQCHADGRASVMQIQVLTERNGTRSVSIAGAGVTPVTLNTTNAG